jgi:hypothetical protein
MVVFCAFLAVAVTMSAGAQSPGTSRLAHCPLQGGWMAEVDIGATFFVTYSSGATTRGGPLMVEWIAGDPTLFGNFPAAVALTQGVGAWQYAEQGTYRYTWISYGVDVAGMPLYSWKGSGTGTIQGCDTVEFDYVAEIFPMPFNPLTDPPVDCISGSGSKHRIPVDLATCP